MQTTRLRELVTANGPFASVYFDDSHDTADAAKLLDLRWREAREELARQGAPEETLDVMETAVRDSAPPVGSSGRALVAAGDHVVLDERLDEPPAQQVARLSDLPYLLPLVEHGEQAPPYVVVVVDHVGADVTAHDEQGRVLEERTVEGSDHPVHKVRGGGWSHRDIQAHTDEVTRHNLDQVAEYVGTVARKIGAKLVVLAGESQARKQLSDLLPEQVRGLAAETSSGGRHKGASNEELHTHVKELLAKLKQDRRAEVTERFRGALGQQRGLAVQGLEATTTALRESNVETLLVERPGDLDVLAGPEPVLVGTQEEELKAQGTDTITRRRADEALAVAAIASGAEIVHTGDRLDLTEGFGAILRHD